MHEVTAYHYLISSHNFAAWRAEADVEEAADDEAVFAAEDVSAWQQESDESESETGPSAPDSPQPDGTGAPGSSFPGDGRKEAGVTPAAEAKEEAAASAGDACHGCSDGMEPW